MYIKKQLENYATCWSQHKKNSNDVKKKTINVLVGKYPYFELNKNIDIIKWEKK